MIFFVFSNKAVKKKKFLLEISSIPQVHFLDA